MYVKLILLRSLGFFESHYRDQVYPQSIINNIKAKLLQSISLEEPSQRSFIHIQLDTIIKLLLKGKLK
jgi:hypothetical protein